MSIRQFASLIALVTITIAGAAVADVAAPPVQRLVVFEGFYSPL